MESTFIASVTGIISYGAEYQRAHDGRLLFAVFPINIPRDRLCIPLSSFHSLKQPAANTATPTKAPF
jgi:hypothetical protein